MAVIETQTALTDEHARVEGEIPAGLVEAAQAVLDEIAGDDGRVHATLAVADTLDADGARVISLVVHHRP